IKTLAAHAPGIKGKVRSVQLLGSAQKLQWIDDPTGLAVTLPNKKPCNYAYALKINGLDLSASEPTPITVAPASVVVRPNNSGVLTLDAQHAQLHGTLQVETRGDSPNIGFWDNPADWASWNIEMPQPGKYNVVARYAAANDASALVVEIAGQQLAGNAAKTAGWEDFQNLNLGQVEIKQAGQQVVKVRPRDAASWHPINLVSLKLTRVQ
ncbi:MAG: hypothetical protein JOZ57_09045, partial [Abitibacteriaceae bacterium]|nr:hypothetical protein [Abditibacteriaceae bacterium]